MQDTDFEELKKQWYNNDAVLFEIIKSLKYRETAFIDTDKTKRATAIRCVKANAVRYLLKNFEIYNFLDNAYNLYNSLSTYPNLPMFSFNTAKKSQETEKFNNEFKSYITGYDFLLDIDNEDVRLSYNAMRVVKEIFDRYNIIYSVKFSGKKGFHFMVEYSDMPESLKKLSFDEVAEKLKIFTHNFSMFHNLGDIDKGIFDLRRISKTPYSVVYPDYFVALPLSDNEIENFALELVTLPRCLSQISRMRYRGCLKREGDVNGFQRLMDDYIFIE